MHHPTDRITHTTAFVTPVVEHWLEREIAQWVEATSASSEADPLILTQETSVVELASQLQHSVTKKALSHRNLLICISRSSQCSTTGVTKAVVCAILSVGWCI